MDMWKEKVVGEQKQNSLGWGEQLLIFHYVSLS